MPPFDPPQRANADAGTQPLLIGPVLSNPADGVWCADTSPHLPLSSPEGTNLRFPDSRGLDSVPNDGLPPLATSAAPSGAAGPSGSSAGSTLPATTGGVVVAPHARRNNY